MNSYHLVARKLYSILQKRDNALSFALFCRRHNIGSPLGDCSHIYIYWNLRLAKLFNISVYCFPSDKTLFFAHCLSKTWAWSMFIGPIIVMIESRPQKIAYWVHWWRVKFCAFLSARRESSQQIAIDLALNACAIHRFSMCLHYVYAEWSYPAIYRRS